MAEHNGQAPIKQDADYIFNELTRSICPECKKVIDAQVLLRDNRVYMRKRCPEHGWFEGLVSSDAESYVSSARFNKPGTMPLEFSTEVKDGCPLDCGLCTEHKQHTCVALIEVNSNCNLDCPICFADAQDGFSLTLAEVESMLDRFIGWKATQRLCSLAAASRRFTRRSWRWLRQENASGKRRFLRLAPQ